MIILLVLAAIVIVWNIVRGVVEESSGDVDAKIITVSSEIKQNKVYIDGASGDLQLDLSRGSDEVDLCFFKVIIEGADRSQNYLIASSIMPLALETEVYYFDITGLGTISKVSVYPLSCNGNLGVAEEYDVSGSEPETTPDWWVGINVPPESCGDGTCDIGEDYENCWDDCSGNVQTISEPGSGQPAILSSAGIHVLDNDIINKNTGTNEVILISSDNVILDCRRYQISDSNTAYIIYSSGNTGITIKNCIINQGNVFDSPKGIFIEGTGNADKINIINNHITFVVPDIGLGIFFSNVNTGLMEHNILENSIIGIFIIKVKNLVLNQNYCCDAKNLDFSCNSDLGGNTGTGNIFSNPGGCDPEQSNWPLIGIHYETC